MFKYKKINVYTELVIVSTFYKYNWKKHCFVF